MVGRRRGLIKMTIDSVRHGEFAVEWDVDGACEPLDMRGSRADMTRCDLTMKFEEKGAAGTVD